jgi:hypothetical protein
MPLLRPSPSTIPALLRSSFMSYHLPFVEYTPSSQATKGLSIYRPYRLHTSLPFFVNKVTWLLTCIRRPHSRFPYLSPLLAHPSIPTFQLPAYAHMYTYR